MIVAEMIDQGARLFADEEAIRFGASSLSFSETARLANRLGATLLDEQGLRPGDHLGLLLDNSLTSIPLDFACAKAGLIRTPLNTRLTAQDHVSMLSGVGARHVVYGAGLSGRAQEILELAPHIRISAVGCDEAGPDLLLASQKKPDRLEGVRLDEATPLLALYTSGTTGKFKAAVHTHASWAAVATNILANLLPIERGDMMLHAASLNHASGTFVLPYWISGGRAGVLPRFDPDAYLDIIERWRPSALNLVPTMISMLLDSPRIEQADLSSVRSIVYGASPMPRATIERGLARLGPRFVQYYGQTEAPLCITTLRPEDHVGEGAEQRLGACGRISSDCRVRIVDEHGVDVEVGETGEIVLRAPFCMSGYNDPQANAEAYLEGGWLRTRDVGRFDEHGLLHLVDRTSDMIITGGYNVYPREVEDVLAAHPGVREVVVVGVPDEKWGEAVAAFVALRAGQAPDEEELIEYCKGRLAGYKAPKLVRFLDEVPKSPVGKLLRRAVRDPYWAGRTRAPT